MAVAHDRSCLVFFTKPKGENADEGTGTYPCVDDALHNLGICLSGELHLLELGFHREGNLLEPLQELVLLTGSDIGVLRSMLPSFAGDHRFGIGQIRR